MPRFATPWLLSAGLAALAWQSSALGDDWPTRPIKLVVSHAPGSSTDIVARYIATQLARGWAQPIVIENKPGGQNIIGAQAVTRAPPDGYTLFYGTTGALVSNLYTIKGLPYDPTKDFVPIRFIGYSPFMIAATSGLKASTLKEALSAPGKDGAGPRVATEGAKTFSGILANALESMSGARWTTVPYSKSSEALQDTIAGRTDLVVLPSIVVMNHVGQGRLRALAVSTASRLPSMPNVPALGETFPGFGLAGWHMLAAPAGTPASVVTRLNRELDALLAKPEIAQHLAALGLDTDPALSTPDQNRQFLQQEHATWQRIARQTGLLPK